MLKDATLGECDEGTVGATDNVRIWVSDTALMSFDEVVGTLVHEYLHNFCRVRGKYMSCDNEHKCMYALEKF